MPLTPSPFGADMLTTPREEQAIELLTQRLHERFPAVPEAKVAATVHEHYHHFDDSRIRDYVPIFVERQARAALAELLAG
jgi:hypothetical protein